MVYDGDILDLEAQNNNDSIYVQLTNDEIMKLFQIPASQHSIHERLETDLHHPIKVQPIIVEEIDSKPLYKKHKSRRLKPSTSTTASTYSSKSKTKSKTKSKREKRITPDYLKTIY